MITDDFDTRPLPEKVYDELRRQISVGDLEPHTRLVQEQIATEMSVSRTPVREALSRLAQEKLVTWVPGMGYIVAKLDRQVVREVQGVRQVLEVAALREALPLYTARDLAELKDVYQEMVDADPETADYVDLTRRFHRILVGPCPNGLLLTYIDDTWTLPFSVKVTGQYGDSQHSIQVMIDEHLEIIQAIEADDRERAIELLDTHISHVHEDMADKA